jgi:hypothetical protein
MLTRWLCLWLWLARRTDDLAGSLDRSSYILVGLAARQVYLSSWAEVASALYRLAWARRHHCGLKAAWPDDDNDDRESSVGYRRPQKEHYSSMNHTDEDHNANAATKGDFWLQRVKASIDKAFELRKSSF